MHSIRKLIARFGLLAALSSPLVCAGQGTFQFVHITFDGPPFQPPGTAYQTQQYFEAGMWFRPLGVVEPGSGFSRRKGGGEGWLAPDNGTTYIAAALGNSLVFSFQNGSPFGVASADLAAYSTVRPNAAIHFVGYRLDGSTITTIVERQGIEFVTHYFGPEWSSGLTRVEMPFPLWSLDNLVVVIPEPSTGTLLLVGTLTFAFWRIRRDG